MTAYDEVLAQAQRLPLAERLRLVSVLASAAAGEVRQASAAWPPPGVTVQLPSAPLAPFPVICGGTWDPDLPLRREELYDDRGRA